MDSNNNTDTSATWDKIQDEFRQRLNEDVYSTWFKQMKCLDIDNACMTLSVPNEFTGYWIQDNYGEIINQTIRSVVGVEAQYRLHAHEDVSSKESVQTTSRASLANDSSQNVKSHKQRVDRANVNSNERLDRDLYLINPRIRFRTLLLGMQMRWPMHVRLL